MLETWRYIGLLEEIVSTLCKKAFGASVWIQLNYIHMRMCVHVLLCLGLCQAVKSVIHTRVLVWVQQLYAHVPRDSSSFLPSFSFPLGKAVSSLTSNTTDLYLL